MKPHEKVRAAYCYSLFTLTDFEVLSTNNNSLHFQKCILFTSHSSFSFATTSSSLGNFFSSFLNFFSGLSGLSSLSSFGGGFLDLLSSFLGSILDLFSGSIVLSFLGLFFDRFNSGFNGLLNFLLVLF